MSNKNRGATALWRKTRAETQDDSTRSIATTGRYLPTVPALYRKALQDAQHLAQHGPVKIIMRDGKRLDGASQ